MPGVPRIVIAGTHSGVGKTTIATGIMAALTAMGLKVQGFKVGPDYIDPSYHTRATGRPSRNLDTWLLGEEGVRELFIRSAGSADIAVIEGVMGLFDGFGGTSEEGSTAHVAKTLEAPVLLVTGAKSMSRSVAAVVKGYSELDPAVNLRGVILNRTAGIRHTNLLTEAIVKYTKAEVVGSLPAEAVVPWPERHLGLVPMAEQEDTLFNDLAKVIAEHLDLELIKQIAAEAAPLPDTPKRIFGSRPNHGEKVRLAYAWDEAFSFYYQDSLDLLSHLGAELLPVSPLHCTKLPLGIQGLLIGGGFPEQFLPQLSANLPFLQSLRSYHHSGLPIYAECGGLMYLTEAVEDFTGRAYPLAGIIPATCKMGKKLAALGYYEGRSGADSILGPQGTPVKGHEFHYSELLPQCAEFPRAFTLHKGSGTPWREDGYAKGSVLASYLHQHLAGSPALAENLLTCCRRFR